MHTQPTGQKRRQIGSSVLHAALMLFDLGSDAVITNNCPEVGWRPVWAELGIATTI